MKLTPDQIQHSLQAHPAWHYEDGQLVRAYTFRNFKEAFSFLTTTALVSEQLDHHAEIWNVYNRVTLKLATHDAGGVTEKDFRWIALVDGA
jgi:4a-hydroxytetrahydrobiopterin dehydratase